MLHDCDSCLGYGWVPKCYWDVYDAVLTPGDLMTVRKRTRCPPAVDHVNRRLGMLWQ